MLSGHEELSFIIARVRPSLTRRFQAILIAVIALRAGRAARAATLQALVILACALFLQKIGIFNSLTLPVAEHLQYRC